eukprot:CAMPEP_0181311858 /NCGR_PEP_ID=MMETSP1101-20121128/13378_1 /TAXON_ID=46948 /ORGANISM="Rhodomonas abbreviata, Strain Caron Lab Isolate" /LENGTH=207 /DNA_ID=CAMNT_0023418651 /DNA_START=58 /DNA_END=681 /DNA_ORIENTATION=+
MKLVAVAGGAVSVVAFSPSLPLRSLSTTSARSAGVCPIRMANVPGKVDIDGGVNAYDRSKDDWGGGTGTGGASGKLPDAPASFEEYMKQRAAEQGGRVYDLAGNDVTDVKPTYECKGDWDGSSSAFNSASASSYEEVNEWMAGDKFEDKSISGFEKQETSWLFEDDEELLRKKEEEKRAKAEQEDAIEAKMAMWLKQAEEKKAQGGN